jgi:thiamine biosynthesis lipoprotein
MARSTLHGPAMGTRWSATCELAPGIDRAALQQALAAAVQQVDAQMSPWRPDSDLQRFNQAAPGTWVALPPALLQVLAAALDVCRASDGAFDPGLGALVDAWGFGAVRRVPDANAIRAARQQPPLPAHQWLELDAGAQRARRHAPQRLDLCAIAKGYAVDCMAAVLQTHGVTQALVALDGELRALGPQADGQPWAVALEAPQPGARTVHGVLQLQDLAVATSGDYRHFFTLQGQRLAHSLDARTQAPVRNDVASVSVLAPTGMQADAWATALLVSGPEAGAALAQRQGLQALWLLRRGQEVVTWGLAPGA